MTDKNKIKVVWLAQFSNAEVRSHLKYRIPLIERIVRKLKHREFPPPADYCQWVTNAIKEFEKFDDVELHIIAPVLKLAKRECHFDINGIHYHIYRDEAGTDIEFIRRNMKANHLCSYQKDKKYVQRLIKTINPDIVHLYGAENLNNAYCLLDVPKHIPTIVQLQTLLSSPTFKAGADMPAFEYEERAKCEKTVIRGADYIGTGGIKFLPTIRESIKHDVIAMVMPLALAEQFNLEQESKEYDFVYFARNISKAADWAIEAFAIVCKKHPHLSLHIIGVYSEDYKSTLDKRIAELGIEDNVVFEGELPTHDDVLRRIRKARYALLPLKVDLVSGTIREAMCNGIPVVSTITPGTPKLNEKRESLLLSEKEDFEGMAANMLRLLEDPSLAASLVENAAATMHERDDNYTRMRQSVAVYQACIKHHKEGTPIPVELLRP